MNTGSFKILGVSYSIYKIFQNECCNQEFKGLYGNLNTCCFVTASDGNFGVAVSYLCKINKQHCKIYLPYFTPEYYVNIMKKNNAEIVFCDGDYDECVQKAIQFSDGNNVKLILDTAIEGGLTGDIAKNVILGYCTMFLEDSHFYDYMFIPTGVGGLLSAAILYNLYIGNNQCKIISVEPKTYNCIQQSIMNGYLTKIKGGDTLMNGLKCGTPSKCAWPLILNGVYGCLGISDDECILAKAELEKKGIDTGYTGAAAYAGYMCFRNNNFENLDRKKILVVNTEKADY